MIKTLFLENYRSYEKEIFEFSSGINVLVGENGAGKTNVLESLYALCTTKPFRNTKREVFIQHEKDYARIKGSFLFDKRTEILEIFWQQNPTKTQKYKKNEAPKKAGDFVREKQFLAVLFSPESMNLPAASPAERRKFLSLLLSPLFSEYFLASIEYEKILKSRNALLKKFAEKLGNLSEFDFWNQKLFYFHNILQKYRRDFFDFANKNIQIFYEQVSGKNDEISLVPIFSVNEDENFLDVLQQSFQKDLILKRTNKGSHRDDFQIFLRGFPLEESASRGETRSALLALKLIEKKYITEITGKDPVLLLDDIFSELDENHRKHILKSLSTTQSIITTTDEDFFSGVEVDKVFRI